MPDSPLEKIAEGREAEIFAYGDGKVVRLMRNNNAMPWLEREAAAMRAAAGAGVRVPAVYETTVVDGRPGLIMERIDGIDMLTLVGRQPWQVFAVGATSGRMHAALHEVIAPKVIPSLKERVRDGIEHSPLVPHEMKAPVFDVLESLPDGDRLCHGDFHPGNILRPDGEPVLIDWPNVVAGEPTADYVRTDLMMRMGSIPPGASLVIRYGAFFARGLMRQAYARAYRRARAIDRALAARWVIPAMAGRLTEDIPEERDKLLRELETRLAP
jgi:aminoglycoside phosphotransferase (APT) family kinase protein